MYLPAVNGYGDRAVAEVAEILLSEVLVDNGSPILDLGYDILTENGCDNEYFDETVVTMADFVERTGCHIRHPREREELVKFTIRAIGAMIFNMPREFRNLDNKSQYQVEALNEEFHSQMDQLSGPPPIRDSRGNIMRAQPDYSRYNNTNIYRDDYDEGERCITSRPGTRSRSQGYNSNFSSDYDNLHLGNGRQPQRPTGNAVRGRNTNNRSMYDEYNQAKQMYAPERVVKYGDRTRTPMRRPQNAFGKPRNIDAQFENPELYMKYTPEGLRAEAERKAKMEQQTRQYPQQQQVQQRANYNSPQLQDARRTPIKEQPVFDQEEAGIPYKVRKGIVKPVYPQKSNKAQVVIAKATNKAPYATLSCDDVWLWHDDQNEPQQVAIPKGEIAVDKDRHDATPFFESWKHVDEKQDLDGTLESIALAQHAIKVSELEYRIETMARKLEEGEELDLDAIVRQTVSTHKLLEWEYLPDYTLSARKAVVDEIRDEKHAENVMTIVDEVPVSFHTMDFRPWAVSLDDEYSLDSKLTKCETMTEIRDVLVDALDFLPESIINSLNQMATLYLNKLLHRVYGLPVKSLDSFIGDIADVTKYMDERGKIAELNAYAKELILVALYPHKTTDSYVKEIRNVEGEANQYVFGEMEHVVVLPISSYKFAMENGASDRVAITNASCSSLYKALTNIRSITKPNSCQIRLVFSDNVSVFVTAAPQGHFIISRN